MAAVDYLMVIDLETTGLTIHGEKDHPYNAREAQIVEIAAAPIIVKYKKRKIEKVLHTKKVAPDNYATVPFTYTALVKVRAEDWSSSAETIHNISLETIQKHGLTLTSMLNQFVEYWRAVEERVGRRLLPASYTPFDIQILNRDFIQHSMVVPPMPYDPKDFVDLQQVIQAYGALVGIPRMRTLQAYAKRLDLLGETKTQTHRAMDDVELTVQVLARLLERLGGGGAWHQRKLF